MTKQLRADLMLMGITVFWGGSYILTKIGLGSLQPFNLTAIRFIIAFLVSAAVFHKHLFRADKKVLQYAFILAVILFGVFISMTFGLQYTSASNAGFLVSLSVVFIPILSFLLLKQKVERRVIISIGFAVFGIAMLTLNSRFMIGLGDFLCILCALLFAAHVVVTGVFTRHTDSIALGVLQLGFVGVMSTVFSMFTERIKLPDSFASWFAVLALSILCTAVGYIVQTTAQQHTSASHTGLILSLEPVFSAVFAYGFLGEILSARGYIGAVILLFSVLFAELDFSVLAKGINNSLKSQ